MPADVVRAFARIFVEGRPDTERAIVVLRDEVGVPSADFFKDFGVRRVAARDWLPADGTALAHVYSRLLHKSIRAPRRGRPPSQRAVLALSLIHI